jgi:ADP-heptose:LPS heptosyltransferase
MNRNYLEELHEHAELPARFAQRFYPAPHELEWAQAQRAQLFPGRLVVIAPTGSSLTKTWPHVQALIDALAAMGVYTLVLGEVRQELEAPEPWCAVLGKDVPIRLAMTLATLADVVVGTESAIINAAAMLDSLKVVLLSHSSPENLTKHWTNTVAVQPPASVGCHPCHRLHNGWTFCQRDQETGFAACQAAVSAEQVLDIIRPALAAPGAILRAA